MFAFFFLSPTLTGKQIVSMIFFYSNLEGFSCHLPAYNSNKNHVAQRYLVVAIVYIAFFVFLPSLLKINI